MAGIAGQEVQGPSDACGRARWKPEAARGRLLSAAPWGHVLTAPRALIMAASPGQAPLRPALKAALSLPKELPALPAPSPRPLSALRGPALVPRPPRSPAFPPSSPLTAPPSYAAVAALHRTPYDTPLCCHRRRGPMATPRPDGHGQRVAPRQRPKHNPPWQDTAPRAPKPPQKEQPGRRKGVPGLHRELHDRLGLALHGTHSSSMEEPVGRSCWSHFPALACSTHAPATPSSAGELHSSAAPRDLPQPSLMRNQVAVYRKSYGGLSSHGLIPTLSDEEERKAKTK